VIYFYEPVERLLAFEQTEHVICEALIYELVYKTRGDVLLYEFVGVKS